MKTKPFLPILIFLLTISAISGQTTKKEFYELKTYTVKNENQEKRVDAYLEKAYLPALKRMGLENIGVFKIRQDKFQMSNKIYVLIPFNSLAEFERMEAMLSVDKTHMTAGKDYLNASYDNPPYERINSVLLRAFPDMPKMKPTNVEGPRSERVYELRSYESPTEAIYKNKVAMFNEGGEVTLFEDLGFNAVFYAEVISGDRMPNLMYMTTFPNMEKRNALWKDFVDSPKWKEISGMEKYQNNVNKLDSFLLYPTEYSDY
ncbi:NIPSNAP family protein [Maribacter aestuarii]|uniref:NIPSNAP family protein n=1 Tax=Maribacter aestuarii TaxID=1130723 RepID=UPI00248CFBFA|nr:NIPSNAP family protein [Maribacter aestuarii]